MLPKQQPTSQQVLGKALINAQKHLSLTQKDLADIIHTSEATINRIKKSVLLNPDSAPGQFAIYFIRIYRSLDALVGGDDQQAAAWLTSYNEHLQAKPIDLIKEMQGIHEVLIYLDAMRGLA